MDETGMAPCQQTGRLGCGWMGEAGRRDGRTLDAAEECSAALVWPHHRLGKAIRCRDTGVVSSKQAQVIIPSSSNAWVLTCHTLFIAFAVIIYRNSSAVPNAYLS